MELFMRNIYWHVDTNQLSTHFTVILHGPLFKDLHPTRMNFHVHLNPDKKRIHPHGGTGILTLPDERIATRFLELFGTARPRNTIVIGPKIVIFEQSKKSKPRRDVMEKIMLPYMDPWIVEQRKRREQHLDSGRVSINTLQFGWECRDFVYSIECETHFRIPAVLSFTDERRELRIELRHDEETYFIASSYSHIVQIFVHTYLEGEPVILLILNTPPSYERHGQPLRERLSFLPIEGHQRVAPYASLAIRLICSSAGQLEEFRRLCRSAQLHRISNEEYPVDRKNIFSEVALGHLRFYLRKLHFCISFQILSLLHSLNVDVREVLQLIPDIVDITNQHGKDYTAALLRKFAPRVQSLYWSEEEIRVDTAVLECFRETRDDMARNPTVGTLKPAEGSICDSFHVLVTPTTMFLEGPFPERSNRVIRAYDPIHQESFLRVSFVEEAKLQYRFDREVDGPGFIRARVGPLLKEGLTIAGRTFQFLAYSQSALKEHAVLFVKPFRDNQSNVVTASKIITSLGKFDGLEFDMNLIYCPARYAARISQAFTATDAVEVEVEEVIPIDDIVTNDGKYQFTDGVGTLSRELADQIYIELKKTKKRGRKARSLAPAAYQIRFKGSKGMVSVNYKLSGLTICTRPSMTKFDAGDGWSTIEIARAFDRPGAYFLNRPLIMLLEGLGVRYEVFESYQNQAVEQTKQARDSFNNAASLLERYGLGTSYRLSSTLLSLQKIGIVDFPDNTFYSKMMDYAINHVLRDLKNHARIPIPGAWTLVGVADIHRYLRPNQIFACIKPVNGATIYLEGPVLISRSPTIHPGDAMIVEAIGRPSPGTCFDAEPIANTVVFSVQGDRPVPSCLGGGDLDGDVYNLVPLRTLPHFRPLNPSPPASYAPAPKKLLDRHSTMDDVADFVMEYINSDVVGIIAINWLLIADQSPMSIFDLDCMKLADLHSNAVDYPKSGQPVPIKEIPKPKMRSKPDWHAPETADMSSGDFYESPRAIGRLFRAIDLPLVVSSESRPTRRRQNRQTRQTTVDDLEESMRSFNLNNPDDDAVFSIIEGYVEEYVPTRDMGSPNWQEELSDIARLFDTYASELRSICLSHTLSHAKGAQLSEEEAIVGTIAQKTSQRRKRKDMMASMREKTDVLVRSIREELEGDASVSNEQYLQRSWMAWELSVVESRAKTKKFGAESFGWVALGAIFDAIREIDESLT